MAKVPNDVMVESRVALQAAEGARPILRKQYADEQKVPMYLSPMYRPYFGNMMDVNINGVHIVFPVDGSTQSVPQTFADEIARRRMAIDNMLTKQNRMSDVASNVEGAPGELSVF